MHVCEKWRRLSDTKVVCDFIADIYTEQRSAVANVTRFPVFAREAYNLSFLHGYRNGEEIDQLDYILVLGNVTALCHERSVEPPKITWIPDSPRLCQLFHVACIAICLDFQEVSFWKGT